MNFLKKIYYYLFCNHELRRTLKYYKVIDNYIILCHILECQRCGAVLDRKMAGKIEVKSKKIRRAVIEHLELNGTKNIE